MMTEGEFHQISTFLKERYGIDMGTKKEIVNGRLENYLRAGNWRDYTEYFRAMQKDETGVLEKDLVNLLTTNHTYFMREFEHFDFLRKEVLPWLRKKEAANRDLCIWCGASSTGEEPYTLAMLLLDFFGLEHSSWDTKVLATDISTEVLQHAIKGIYRPEQVIDIPDNWKRRFFTSIDGGGNYRISDEVKREVMFRQFNLMEPFPFKRKMHIVFLRNVMLYFDQETKKKLIQKVYDSMEPGGYLFIGRTETIDRSDVPFKMIQPSIFQK